ncbi:phosphotransferase enzyme family protein [Rhizosphaericola mali]|uniref:Phosphotransferase n=1 Tax=Rhizosphaericola mali TaxID=2545455 RepID=A0A5P2FW22_9BACT|nr:phosphotransferase [Rhizosphaericola mali]QES87716.1 phosphotransferase [Rhizosphaericola mali]
MIEKEVFKDFDLPLECEVIALNTGLINNSFVVKDGLNKAFLIQKINHQIFSKPIDIQKNYLSISNHLKEKNSFHLPEIILTNDNKLITKIQDDYWRCMEFIQHSFSPLIANNSAEAFTVAQCFGKYSADLLDIDISKIKIILPGFHDLNLRFQQFRSSLQTATESRKSIVKEEIRLAFVYESYVDLFNYIVTENKQFPLHILHQDCKIANILFSDIDNSIICPIDLDTTQPGLFFSDLGDMIRSMVPNISENEIHIENMEIREDFLLAIKDGYLDAMGKALTKAELAFLDKSGPIIIYMQALRFLTDFLNGDIYYRTNYEMQNRDRAKNQFHLLQLLNKVVESKVSNPLFSV